MTTIISSRPHGVNHRPAPPVSHLTVEQELRLERRILAAELAQLHDRPCLPNAAAWDVNVAKPAAQKLCRDCPIAASRRCGRVALIDEAIVAASSGPTAFSAIVSGTRGGMNAFTRRPLVKALAAKITADRAERAERKKARAEAAKEAA